MNKRIRFLFFASLVLNLALAGMFLGHMSHRFLWAHGHRFSESLLAQLPEEKRQQFETTMHYAAHEMEPMRAQLADMKKEAARLLAAEPFSEEAYLNQMQHVSDLHAQMKRHMSKAVAGLARQFTPEERTLLSEIVFRSLPDAHAAGSEH